MQPIRASNRLVCLLVISFWVTKQPSSIGQQSPYYRIEAGANPNHAMPFNARYQYPDFLTGKIYVRNGNPSIAQFNYNRWLGEMHFIDPKGDTLALANDPRIQQISIGQDVYYYEYPGQFWQLAHDYPSVKLVRKQTLMLIDAKKQGGYGQSTATGAIRTTTTVINSNGSVARLSAQTDMLFTKKVVYKLLDQNNRFFTPKQSVILSLFSRNKQEIRQYLQKNPVDFNEETSLKQLLDFCTGIP